MPKATAIDHHGARPSTASPIVAGTTAKVSSRPAARSRRTSRELRSPDRTTSRGGRPAGIPRPRRSVGGPADLAVGRATREERTAGPGLFLGLRRAGSALEHPHGPAEPVDRASGGQVLPAADPVLDEVGSPDGNDDNEHQGRGLHGHNRRECTGPPSAPRAVCRRWGCCDSWVFAGGPSAGHVGLPAWASSCHRVQRWITEPVVTSSRVRANVRWSRQAPSMCRYRSRTPSSRNCRCSHDRKRAGVLGPDVDLDPVQAGRYRARSRRAVPATSLPRPRRPRAGRPSTPPPPTAATRG